MTKTSHRSAIPARTTLFQTLDYNKEETEQWGEREEESKRKSKSLAGP